MTVIFTEEERMWIEIDKFDWKIKDGCPTKLKKSIERKLMLLNGNK